MQKRYLEGIKKQLLYYKTLGERTFSQLQDEDLFREISSEANSISIIVNHVAGNMKSRFTDFLTSDGEKTWRHRDREFEDVIKNRSELLGRWEEGWKIVFNALDEVNDLESIVLIRNQEHTVYEAINRQLAHYAYHIGQIVYIGKCCLGEKWKSLSIPKDQSQTYNSVKFSQQHKDQHFTDDFIKS